MNVNTLTEAEPIFQAPKNNYYENGGGGNNSKVDEYVMVTSSNANLIILHREYVIRNRCFCSCQQFVVSVFAFAFGVCCCCCCCFSNWWRVCIDNRLIPRVFHSCYHSTKHVVDFYDCSLNFFQISKVFACFLFVCLFVFCCCCCCCCCCCFMCVCV